MKENKEEVLKNNEKKEKAVISVVVPVFNVEKYLRECLDSICNQTLSNIEIICVDDCSTDNSLEILKEYEKKDSRIKVLHHEKNKGLLLARKTGVDFATTEYCFFADSDDSLREDACEVVLKQIEENHHDVIMYALNVVFKNDFNKQQKNDVLTYFSVKPMQCENEDIFKKCFMEKKYSYNLVGKVVRTEILKKVYSLVVDEHIIMAEDFYTYFLISLFAKTFTCIPDKLYNYNLGLGITGHSVITFNAFHTTARITLLINDIKKHLAELNFPEEYFKTADSYYDGHYINCIYWWYYQIKKEDKAKAFDLLVKYFGKEATFKKICADFFDKQTDVCTFAKGAETLNINRKEIKSVGILLGETNTVDEIFSACALANNLAKKGFDVVCICEDKVDVCNVTFENVKLCTIPSSEKIKENKYFERAKVLSDCLLENKVDAVIYQPHTSCVAGFDSLLIKLMNIFVVPVLHKNFLYSANYITNYIPKDIANLGLADTICTPTEEESEFWLSFGYNATKTPEMLSFNPKDNEPSALDNKTVLWFGSFEDSGRQPIDAVEVFKLVKPYFDAKLVMVNTGKCDWTENKIKQKIADYGLQQDITVCKHDFNHDYYAEASVFLNTSACEGFPHALVKAMSYGLPCVSYDIPYVSLLQNEGCYACPAKDLTACANAIIKLFKDDEMRLSAGKKQREVALSLAKNDCVAEWKKIFTDLVKGNKKESDANKLVPQIVKALMHNPQSSTYFVANEPVESAFKRLKRKIKQIGLWGTFKLCVKKVLRRK